MIQGLYAAANGMMAVEDRQSVIANNIANALTPGFKRQVAVQEGFENVFFGESKHPAHLNQHRAPGGGVKLTQTFTDYSNGVLNDTGNPLDMALVGPGFFTVETPDGPQFTRNGRFATSAEGQLVTNHGFPVMSTEGTPIDVSGGVVEVGGDGIVRVNGEARGQLQVLEFEDPHMLNRSGMSLLQASDEMVEQALPAPNTTVAGKTLEMANVQTPKEMTNLMMALRAYSANQKVISAIDQTASRLIDRVGTPGA